MRFARLAALSCLLLVLILSGCGIPRSGRSPQATAAPVPTSQLGQLDLSFEPTTPEAGVDAGPTIIISADGPARPFDRRLLGTNLPAWIGPERMANPQFQARLKALGPTLLRLPGGSWSNGYDWLACENGDETGCYWTWAARPTDFLNLLRATGQQGMWTVSINGTAQEAAALVAFFNGSVDDERSIGTDLRGRDWKTVGHWARLRAEHGNPQPLPIKLWEVGNEIYGGKEGRECSEFGWEDVWSCDGAEYVNGADIGTERYEGYLAFREAMRAVDPSIQVGAVGTEDPFDWSNWGNEVIGIAGEKLDFYSVHQYAFGETPESAALVLSQPQQIWPSLIEALDTAQDRYAGGRRAPIAVTEYNLVAFQDLDTGLLMRRAVNALFIADTIGQMAEQGVSIATHWDLANGRATNGTDYGLIDADTFVRSPQYYAFVLWQRFGDELLPVTSSLPADTELSVYAGRAADGTISLLAINKTAAPISATVNINGGSPLFQGQIDVLRAESLLDADIHLNDVADPANDLSDAPAQTIGPFSGPFEQIFAPYSVTLLRLAPAS